MITSSSWTLFHVASAINWIYNSCSEDQFVRKAQTLTRFQIGDGGSEALTIVAITVLLDAFHQKCSLSRIYCCQCTARNYSPGYITCALNSIMWVHVVGFVLYIWLLFQNQDSHFLFSSSQKNYSHHIPSQIKNIQNISQKKKQHISYK